MPNSNPSDPNPESSPKSDPPASPASSKITSIRGDLSKGPELEVDDDFESRADAPVLETDPVETAGADRAEAPTSPPADGPDAGTAGHADTRRKRAPILAIVLGVLLLVSLGVNLLQARTTARLEARNREFESALNEAVAVVDQETLRANLAESTLTEIEGAAETVRDRIDALQQALDELQRVTQPEAAGAE
ncbi:MAG TPA: hypothetical protein ENI85_04080 [Deltaproteobacteria bacterium]|nr:hypothetical protein [Deltaproteobacteria bacterium]